MGRSYMTRSHSLHLLRPARYQNSAIRCPNVAITSSMRISAGVSMVPVCSSPRRARQVSMHSVDQFQTLSFHDQGQVFAHPEFLAQPFAVLYEVELHWNRRSVLAVKELRCRGSETDGPVVGQERGDAIDIALL